MIYLIAQTLGWLLLTAAFAAVAGGAFAAERAAPKAHALRRERDNLVRDILKLATEDAEVKSVQAERESDAMRRQLDIRAGRIRELEHMLETARGRADAAAGEAAELQRRLEQIEAEAQQERERAVEVAAEPVPDEAQEEAALQGWRLRYFEQRVRYLESQAHAAAPQTETAAAPEQAATPPVEAWRAREAEARAEFLANQLRAMQASPAAEEAPPFAASADIDALLRWRMLYLERRLAHLQHTGAAAHEAPPPARGEPDRWKWRARYLEARVRHLEQRAGSGETAPQVPAPQPAAEPTAQPEPVAVESAPEAPPPPAVTRRKPPVLAAARNGAPDDLTLIDGVSPLQHATLNAMGIFHFDQIAAWTAEHVAWVDNYLRLGGRIEEEEWLEQAATLARHGPAAARRVAEEAV